MSAVKHTTRQCKNLIGGKWVHAHSRQTFEDRNPAKTSDLVGVFPASGTKDVADAVAAAKEAFETWRLVPAPKRAEILYRTGELLTERKEKYAHDMTREMGKVLAETRGDVQEAIDTAYLHGRRRPPPLRPDHALRAAEQVRHVASACRWASAA